MSWQVVLALGVLAAAGVGIYLVVRYMNEQNRRALAAEAEAAQARAEAVDAQVARNRHEAERAAGELTPEQMLGRLTERP